MVAIADLPYEGKGMRGLPDRAGHLSDANFISRMIYKDKY